MVYITHVVMFHVQHMVVLLNVMGVTYVDVCYRHGYVTDADVWSIWHKMTQPEQVPDHMTGHVTDGCVSHFRDAFAELALLQQHAMFCDITLFVCEDTKTANVDSQSSVDVSLPANTESSRLYQPVEGSTEQVL